MSIDLKTRYCQSLGAAPIDWYEAINEAEELCSPLYWSDLYNYSSSWITCAVGNQCAILERDQYGAPKDKMIRYLGLEFSSAIERYDAHEARRLLNQIERRSAKLIAKMLARSLNKEINKILKDDSHGTRHVSEQKDLCSAVVAPAAR